MDTDERHTEEPRIRPVDANHIGELIRIGDETRLSPWSAQSYIEELKNPSSIMLRLVADDNSILGFVVGRLVIGISTGSQDAEIYNIAVIPTHQRKGCGQMLFDAFAGLCDEKDVENIWLEVRESNTPAIRFYERNGFTRVQTRNHFYENPREHASLMRLSRKKYDA